MGELGQRFTRDPFERHVVQPVLLVELVRLHDGRMRDAGAVSGFAEEALDRGLVVPQALLEDFDGAHAMFGVLGAVDNGRAAFTYAFL